MATRVHTYEGQDLEITYDVVRCIHAAACVQGLPQVFDLKRRPWVDPAQAPADQIAQVIERCPTGALHYRRLDDGAAEMPTALNTVQVDTDGPLYLRGQIRVVDAEGETVIKDTRLALCRCGASSHKPYCDGSHTEAGFADAGALGTNGKLAFGPQEEASGEALTVHVFTNGPLVLQGPAELHGADDGPLRHGTQCALCRCGASNNKPFCDGSHKQIGFEAA
ncbi:MAG: CDGSH iron-sulfur domain-containing protein [Bacteroidota bacterium]